MHRFCKQNNSSLLSFVSIEVSLCFQNAGQLSENKLHKQMGVKTFVNLLVSGCPKKRMPYPKRDLVKSPISFGFHGKQEAIGKNFLAESYITKFNATLFIVVFTFLSLLSKVSLIKIKFLRTEMKKLLCQCLSTWPIYLSSESAQKTHQ